MFRYLCCIKMEYKIVYIIIKLRSRYIIKVFNCIRCTVDSEIEFHCALWYIESVLIVD